MAKKLEIYKCNICGIVVETLNGGDGQMFCCNEPMMNMAEQQAAEICRVARTLARRQKRGSRDPESRN